MEVKMLVQTMYKNQLLREGMVYDIPDATAERWIVSRIAETVTSEEE